MEHPLKLQPQVRSLASLRTFAHTLSVRGIIIPGMKHSCNRSTPSGTFTSNLSNSELSEETCIQVLDKLYVVKRKSKARAQNISFVGGGAKLEDTIWCSVQLVCQVPTFVQSSGSQGGRMLFCNVWRHFWLSELWGCYGYLVYICEYLEARYVRTYPMHRRDPTCPESLIDLGQIIY